ncbi:GAD-like domain-containing protein [Kingella oralis]|uniref:GAD-like domain-containing protein n=1 Tax=Kingella oralis TaxID=505 RepID=UPI0034E418BC
MSAATLINKYRGKLPDRLLEYWQEYGFCHFADGLFWLTNPEDYEDILAEWLPENVQ